MHKGIVLRESFINKLPDTRSELCIVYVGLAIYSILMLV